MRVPKKPGFNILSHLYSFFTLLLLHYNVCRKPPPPCEISNVLGFVWCWCIKLPLVNPINFYVLIAILNQQNKLFSLLQSCIAMSLDLQCCQILTLKNTNCLHWLLKLVCANVA